MAHTAKWGLMILSAGTTLGVLLGAAAEPDMIMRPGPEQEWQKRMHAGSSSPDYEYVHVDAGVNVRQMPPDPHANDTDLSAWGYSYAPPFIEDSSGEFFAYVPSPDEGIPPEYTPPEYVPDPIRPPPLPEVPAAGEAPDGYAVVEWPDDLPDGPAQDGGPRPVIVSSAGGDVAAPGESPPPSREPRIAQGELPAIW